MTTTHRHRPGTFRPVGFNFGGWLSQSPLTDAHADAFLGRADFKAVADWGFNSVRLPVDALFLWPEGGQGRMNEDRFRFLLKAFHWAWDAGLLVIFDLHQSAWHSFAKADWRVLWEDPKALEGFSAQWEELASRFKAPEGPLWAELLNEPTAPDAETWDKTAEALVKAARRGNPHLPLVVESNRWGSVDHLESLARRVSGDGVLMSFHFYEPMFFTHQKAPWWKAGAFFNETVEYPGEPARWREYLSRADLSGPQRCLVERNGRDWNKEALKDRMGPAFALARKGVPLYCGEFGAYEKAPRPGRLAWTRDVVDLLREMNAGWSYWNYKLLDFGVVGRPLNGAEAPVDGEMLSVLRGGI